MKRIYFLNDKIKAKKIRLILDNGKMYGIISKKKALEIAMEKRLDLMQVSFASDKDFPICKLLNYGKLKYERNKNKKQHKERIKEIRFRINISDHDLEVKNKKVRELLLKKKKVKYVLEMRGREIQVQKRAEEKINKNLMLFKDIASWIIPKFSRNSKLASFFTILSSKK